MDLIRFWSDQTELWNTEEKCGLCWSFGAPLEESATNIQQLKSEENCCVQLFITDIRWGETPRFANTGFVNGKDCAWHFNLWALVSSKIGINNWNEIIGYSTDDSKWATIFQPLMDCLGCDKIIDICAILGYNVDIPKWEGRLITNYQDMNYAGWKIEGTFRIKK